MILIGSTWDGSITGIFVGDPPPDPGSATTRYAEAIAKTLSVPVSEIKEGPLDQIQEGKVAMFVALAL